MTTNAFLLAAVLAASPAPVADTVPGVSTFPVEVLLPAELVASRVRSVLQDHTDPDAWQGLAGTLPDMIVRGGGDVASLFEAARLADEMSGTLSGLPVTVTAAPQSESPPASAGVSAPTFVWPAWLDLRWAERLYENGLGFVVWVAMALFGVLVVLRLFRRGGGGTTRVMPVRTRLRDARALAGQGRSIPEISRETRLAREALSVLLQPHVG